MRQVKHVMGTVVSLDLASALPPARLHALADEVFDWLHEVDRRFSPFRSDSEVSLAGQRSPSPLMRSVLDRCTALWTETLGYFDVYATGRFDPSAYVKGWSVQVASDRLLEQGCADHCLNAGGDVRVRGEAAAGRPWRVGVRHPWQADQICHVVEGTDLAVATSGVYERGHHVVDPLAGGPAHGLRSVTVVGPDLGDADAYSTAALAMGERGASWVAGLPGYASIAVTDDGRVLQSEGMEALTASVSVV